VILQSQSRWEYPGIGNLAERRDGPLPVDLVLGKAAEQFGGKILIKEVGESRCGDDLGADIGIGAGDDNASRPSPWRRSADRPR
jgi:hypothetical protein